MEIKVLAQGYNLELHSSLAEVLIDALQDDRYTSFRCMVAFASYGAATAFTPYILRAQPRYEEIKFIIGIDQQGTSKEALEEISSWGIDSYVYHSTSINIFHPKIYIFEGREDYLIIIGSNNFTELGLVKNIECSFVVSHRKINPDDRGLLSEVEQNFNTFFLEEDANLKRLTADLITTLAQSGLLTPEYTREKRHDRKVNTDNERQQLFSSTAIQRNPNGFSPKRIIRSRQPLARRVAQPEMFGDTDNWIGDSSNQMLIAEIGGPGRWQQVNFPLQMFREFFGATAGDNSYHIDLKYLYDSGELSDIEKRQAVTVASQNYRFEIGAARGPYPVGVDRPICIFIRVATRNFIYKLYMPNTDNYQDLKAYLYANYNGPARFLKRIIQPYAEIAERLDFVRF